MDNLEKPSIGEQPPAEDLEPKNDVATKTSSRENQSSAKSNTGDNDPKDKKKEGSIKDYFVSTPVTIYPTS